LHDRVFDVLVEPSRTRCAEPDTDKYLTDETTIYSLVQYPVYDVQEKQEGDKYQDGDDPWLMVWKCSRGCHQIDIVKLSIDTTSTPYSILCLGPSHIPTGLT